MECVKEKLAQVGGSQMFTPSPGRWGGTASESDTIAMVTQRCVEERVLNVAPPQRRAACLHRLLLVPITPLSLFVLVEHSAGFTLLVCFEFELCQLASLAHVVNSQLLSWLWLTSTVGVWLPVITTSLFYTVCPKTCSLAGGVFDDRLGCCQKHSREPN